MRKTIYSFIQSFASQEISGFQTKSLQKASDPSSRKPQKNRIFHKKKIGRECNKFELCTFLLLFGYMFQNPKSSIGPKHSRCVSESFPEETRDMECLICEKYLVSKHNKVSSQSETAQVCLRCRRQIPLLGVALLHENETMRGKF